MNQQMVKKLKKLAKEASKHSGRDYMRHIRGWSFTNRLSFAWWLLFGDIKRVD